MYLEVYLGLMINKTNLKELGSHDLFCSIEDLLDAFKIKMPKINNIS